MLSRPLRAPVAFALLAAVLLAGCVTPSVPIPPPKPEAMTFEVDFDLGSARFAYQPDPSYAFAIVYVFNRDAGRGVITTANADGSVSPTDPFPAEIGDAVIVTFELEQQLASTCVRLQDGPSSSALRCDF
jgi:hypothetical protein